MPPSGDRNPFLCHALRVGDHGLREPRRVPAERHLLVWVRRATTTWDVRGPKSGHGAQSAMIHETHA